MFAEVRQAALHALAFLTRARHAMTDEAMRAYLRRLGQTLTDAEDPLIGAAWAQVVAALGYDDLGPEVARAISKGVVDPDFYDIKEFHADLRVARDDPAGLALFAREGVEPFGSRSRRCQNGSGVIHPTISGSIPAMTWTSIRSRHTKRSRSRLPRRRSSTRCATSAATIPVRAAAARNTRSAVWRREAARGVRSGPQDGELGRSI